MNNEKSCVMGSRISDEVLLGDTLIRLRSNGTRQGVILMLAIVFFLLQIPCAAYDVVRVRKAYEVNDVRGQGLRAASDGNLLVVIELGSVSEQDYSRMHASSSYTYIGHEGLLTTRRLQRNPNGDVHGFLPHTLKDTANGAIFYDPLLVVFPVPKDLQSVTMHLADDPPRNILLPKAIQKSIRIRGTDLFRDGFLSSAFILITGTTLGFVVGILIALRRASSGRRNAMTDQGSSAIEFRKHYRRTLTNWEHGQWHHCDPDSQKRRQGQIVNRVGNEAMAKGFASWVMLDVDETMLAQGTVNDAH